MGCKMIHGTKEEHDLYTAQTITNLANDEKAFAIDKYPPFHSNHEAYAVMLKELEETAEQLGEVHRQIKALWQMTKGNFPQDLVKQQLEKIAFECKQLTGESIQIYAVALKAIEQLGVRRVFEDDLATKTQARSIDSTEEVKRKAFELFKEGYKNIQVASQLNITRVEVRMLRTSYKNSEGRIKKCQQEVMCSNS